MDEPRGGEGMKEGDRGICKSCGEMAELVWCCDRADETCYRNPCIQYHRYLGTLCCASEIGEVEQKGTFR